MNFLQHVLLNRLYPQKIWEDKKQENYFHSSMQNFLNVCHRQSSASLLGLYFKNKTSLASKMIFFIMDI